MIPSRATASLLMIALVASALVACKRCDDRTDRTARATGFAGGLLVSDSDGTRALFLITSVYRSNRFKHRTSWRFDLVSISDGRLIVRKVLGKIAEPQCRAAYPGRLWCIEGKANDTLVMRDAKTLAVTQSFADLKRKLPQLAKFHRIRVAPKNGNLAVTAGDGDYWLVDAKALSAKPWPADRTMTRLPPLQNNMSTTTNEWPGPKGSILLATGNTPGIRLVSRSAAGHQKPLRDGFLPDAAFLKRKPGMYNTAPALGAQGKCAVLVYKKGSKDAASLVFECIDRGGKAKWSLNAPAGSPSFSQLHDNVLIVAVGASDSQSYALAIDVTNGKRLWRYEI